MQTGIAADPEPALVAEPVDDDQRRRDVPLYRRSRSPLGVLALWVALAVPFVVALLVLADPTWYPVLDLAMTELQVRDVGTDNSPLVGLAGRIGTAEQGGSHPGPLSFWAMWPFYQLFGAGAFALQAAAVSLHLLALGAVLWMAHRRGGLALALGFAATMALLVRGYGTVTLTEAWNPYLPVLWFVVALVAVWCVLCRDYAMVPVATFAGSFCAQTHIPYVGLVGGLALLTVAGVAYPVIAARRGGRPVEGHPGRWAAVGAAVGVVLWLPPIIQELTASPGNLTVIWRTFAEPSDAPIGFAGAAEPLLVHLNPWNLLATRTLVSTGSILPGAALLGVWALAVGAAWRLRHRLLLRLHAVLAVALALGVVSVSRIHGFVWYYLLHWAWGITALMVLAVGWAAAATVAARRPTVARHSATRRRRATAATTTVPARTVAGGALVATTLVLSGLFAVDATGAEVPTPRLSESLADVTPPTIAALQDGVGPATGRDGRYLVTWADPIHLNSQGYGLLLELDRQGFDVGARQFHRVSAGLHRAYDPEEATARVHVAVGPAIETQRAAGDLVEVAYADPRTAAEQAEFARLRADAIAELEADGLDEVASMVDDNLFLATTRPEITTDMKDRLERLLGLGTPIAVFVGPVGEG